MSDLVIHTFDWVPAGPRGFVRDLRVRWALEEAGLPYRVQGVPLRERGPAHLAHQPFGQVPWLEDGELSIFETGAILLHLGERSEALLSVEPHTRSETVQWLFAALNSVEMAVLPWSIFKFSGIADDSAGAQRLAEFLESRLAHLDPVFARQEWLAGRFSIADVLMADVLRLVERHDGFGQHGPCREYLARATARPAFRKALADQLAHFVAADAARA